MRSYHTDLGAGIDGLSVREHETPEPDLNEVLVDVRASSLSFRELMVLRGWVPAARQAGRHPDFRQVVIAHP